MNLMNEFCRIYKKFYDCYRLKYCLADTGCVG
jgi:hypothetical protein